jgi:peptidoglycan/xylan/chitin deacetylase (PgdA/CDA1 family)
MHSNRLKKRSVCITFDDGYVDNLHFAYPLLLNSNTPATIFVCSQYIDKDREYWWDELERIMLVSTCIPNDLLMNIDGQEYRWSLNSYGQRMRTYYQVHKTLKSLNEIKRKKALSYLLDWAGQDDRTRTYYRPINSTEIRKLAQNDLIHIGSHAMTHSTLSSLTYEEQYFELLGSKEHIENITNSPVLIMAYPHGAYNWETLQAAREVGIQIACTTKESYVGVGTDCLQFPRFGVKNWDLDTFKKKIDAFFNKQ